MWTNKSKNLTDRHILKVIVKETDWENLIFVHLVYLRSVAVILPCLHTYSKIYFHLLFKQDVKLRAETSTFSDFFELVKYVPAIDVCCS